MLLRDFVQEMEDFFGKKVILASRITGPAQGGKILVSSLLKELTESAGDIQPEDHRLVSRFIGRSEYPGLVGTLIELCEQVISAGRNLPGHHASGQWSSSYLRTGAI